MNGPSSAANTGLELAIVGMAARLPGAASVAEFWSNLVQGIESLVEIDEATLRRHGVPEALSSAPDYVKVGGVLADADCFDAGFFGYSPREAELLDPQHRLFLQCAFHALETAGYDTTRYAGLVGVYAGAGMNGYLFNLYRNARIRHTASPYELFVANDKDFLTTRASYKLDLRGPSVAVQTACSSSLVAVHLACQALLSGECDMALAGGVAVSRQVGYRVQAGSLYSPDGHCRAFDARAAGTVGGNGVGAVVLKRLADALADGDSIDAVIKGSAINNDGALKVSYTAPRIDTQAAVIESALAVAGVSAEDIDYVEAHGTGTALGDPIEIAALTQAFRRHTTREGYCAIGSVKTNVGHLDAAAGVAGLIKAALMLKHARMPASLHFERPNPQIDFARSPFFVNAELRDWPADDRPRRAGVSSFGIGGTNAHVILEEAPALPAPAHSTTPQLLVCAAKTPAALNELCTALADHLEANDGQALADVAHTLRVGRRAFRHRHSLVAATHADAARALRRLAGTTPAAELPSIVFLFPGQGSQYPGMARGLYATSPAFRAAIDRCASELAREARIDLRALLFESDAALLAETAHAQPALFAVGYALSEWWKAHGIVPTAMLGHSLGEYVAACVAGVFPLAVALRLVAARGRLMQGMARGRMLAVGLAPAALEAYLDPSLEHSIEVAAHNAPQWQTLAGPSEAIESLATRLGEDGIACSWLPTSHAFHSAAMAPMMEEFTALVAASERQAPRVPFVSNLSGTWITAEEATSADYWSRQLRHTVQFSAGLDCVLALPSPLLLELGPGHGLSGLARAHRREGPVPAIAHSLPPAQAADADVTQALSALGSAWCAGAALDWSALATEERAPRRLPLPNYPFAREVYRVEADAQESTGATPAAPARETQPRDWLYVPTWQRSSALAATPSPTARPRWLVFADDTGVGAALEAGLERAGQDVYTVTRGDAFAQRAYRGFTLDPAVREDFDMLLASLRERDAAPSHVVYLWPLDAAHTTRDDELVLPLLHLLQTLGADETPRQIAVVTDRTHELLGDEALAVAPAALRGLCQSAGQEYPQLGCRQIDLDATAGTALLADQLQRELRVPEAPAVVAYRGRHRWLLQYTALPASADDARPPGVRLRREACYALVGAIDEAIARAWTTPLLTEHAARLVLIDTRPQDEAEFTPPAGCLLLRADPTQPDSLRQALRAAVERCGPLRGVFHCSPTTNRQAAAPLALLEARHWDYNRRSKLADLERLAEALSEHAPQFCCVQSSMSSVIGGLGLAAYAGAHHALETFVAARNRDTAWPWFALAFDACREADADAPAGMLGAALAEFALTPQEVWAVTAQALAHAPPGQVVISRSDLAPRLAQWISGAARQLEAASAETGALHPRPALATPYRAPGTDVERTIAAIWQSMLGIDEIGVDDNFFELGGHSLLAIQILSRLRGAFPIEIEMRHLLTDEPTVARLAAQLEAELPQADTLDQMADLLEEIAQLSEDEVAAHLPASPQT